MNEEDREHEEAWRKALAANPAQAQRFAPIVNSKNRIKGYSSAVDEPKALPIVGIAAHTVALAGSVRRACAVCFARTWFSPKAQSVVSAREALRRHSVLVCDRCALHRQDRVMQRAAELDEKGNER